MTEYEGIWEKDKRIMKYKHRKWQGEGQLKSKEYVMRNVGYNVINSYY
jgi:hypothetical protein